MTASLEQALALHDAGINVAPGPKGGKTPFGKWKHHQTEHQSTQWVEQAFSNGHGDANVIVFTGPISGLLVLDCDDETSRAWWRERLGPVLDETTRVRTSQGWHYWFRLPAGAARRNGSSDGSDGSGKWDIRCEGGLVVAPPSVHKTGHAYAWVEGRGLDALQDAAEALLGANSGSKSRSTGQGGSSEINGSTRAFENGARNDGLTKLAGSIVNEYEEWTDADARIRKENQRRCEPPLDDAELASTVLKSAEGWHREAWAEKQPVESGAEAQAVTTGWRLHSPIARVDIWGRRSKSPVDIYLQDGTKLHFEEARQLIETNGTLNATILLATGGASKGPSKPKKDDLLHWFGALTTLANTREEHDERAEFDEWVQTFLTSTLGEVKADWALSETAERYEAACAFQGSVYHPMAGGVPIVVVDRVTGERFFKTTELKQFVYHRFNVALSPVDLKERAQQAGYGYKLLEAWPAGYGRDQRQSDKQSRRRVALFVDGASS